jgi:hypothetical protein
MALIAAEVRARVAQAEQLWNGGDWAAAFDRYSALFGEMVIGAGDIGRFGSNEFLVMDRYADLAVQIGRVKDALDLYRVLAAHARASEIRDMAAFKRLQVAVEAGQFFVALEAYEAVLHPAGAPQLPGAPAPALLASWEGAVTWSREERPSLLAQMYLALGKLYNAQRRIEESSSWLKRGLLHAKGPGRAGATGVPLQLALANNYLSAGELDQCRATLEFDPGPVYAHWHMNLAAKLAVTQGRLADALHALDSMSADASAHSMFRPLAVSGIAQAEIRVLLNQLPEADEALDRAERTARDCHFEDLLAYAARVRLLRFARAKLIDSLVLGGSVRRMQAGGEDLDASERVLQRFDETAVIWSGDYLREYERRETRIYAALERNPDDAVELAKSLWRDFEHTGSLLISARLHFVSGLLLAARSDQDQALREFEQAGQLFLRIGAERELYQATAHLAWSIEKREPQRFASLLEENKLRLEKLAAGLSGEQRNALSMNKFAPTEAALRIEAEEILGLRHKKNTSHWFSRPVYTIRFHLRLHALLCALDAEREQRRKTPAEGRRRTSKAGWRTLLGRVALHARNNLTIGYLALPDRTYAISIRRWRLDIRRLSLGRVALSERVRKLHACISAPEPEIAAEFGPFAEALCREFGLQDLIAAAPSRIRSLTFVLDAQMWGIPFCALRYSVPGDGCKYIVERFAINVDECFHPRRHTRAGDHVLVAHYEATGPRKLKRAAVAARTVSDWMRRHRSLPCVEARDRASCLHALPDACLFYYFGHGQFSEGKKRETGLEFGPDLFLSIDDLDAIDFTAMEQAVLLGCYGSDVTPFLGRWTVSLPALLMRSGARSVLGGLWEILEDVAACFSDEFLPRAVAVGRACALQELQIQLLNKGRPPYEWAALQIYGDGGPLRLRNRQKSWRKSNPS